MQAGHGVSRRFNSTLFHEQNNHAQCGKCNVLMNGEQYLYACEVDKKYGDGTFDSLIKLSRESKKFTTFELEELIKEYEEKFKQLRIQKKL